MDALLPTTASNSRNTNLCISNLPIRTPKKVCCIGAGYVGGPISAMIACKNPDIEVHVVDIDETQIQAWKSDVLPVTEPDLLPIVRSSRDGTNGRPPNLRFSTNVAQAINDADLIFIAVNTPPKKFGRGAQQALDISYVEAAAEAIARASTTDKVVVEKSTVPCGTSDSIKRIFAATGQPGVHFDVISNPEFLAEGTAVADLLSPDRVLIGSDQDAAGLRAARVVSSIYESWIPTDRIIFMNTQSAELTKLAANALLAQRISSINALSAICEKTNANVDEVAFACGLDMRIGPNMLKASLGFGGSCLKKDVLTLAHLADELDLSHIGSYWRSIDDINELQKSRFIDKIVKKMNNTLVRKKVTVLGCAFKKGTGDIRESPGVSLIADLLAEQAQISVYDPKVQHTHLLRVLSQMPKLSQGSDAWMQKLSMCPSIYTACDGAHAIVIATEREEFADRKDTSNGTTISTTSQPVLATGVDWAKISLAMRHPKLLFDGHNIVNDQALAKLGIEVHMIGKLRHQVP